MPRLICGKKISVRRASVDRSFHLLAISRCPLLSRYVIELLSHRLSARTVCSCTQLQRNRLVKESTTKPTGTSYVCVCIHRTATIVRTQLAGLLSILPPRYKVFTALLCVSELLTPPCFLKKLSRLLNRAPLIRKNNPATVETGARGQTSAFACERAEK